MTGKRSTTGLMNPRPIGGAHVEDLGARGHRREAEDVVVPLHRVVGEVRLERGGLGDAHRELRQVVEDEREHDVSRPAHVARRDRGPYPLFNCIGLVAARVRL